MNRTFSAGFWECFALPLFTMDLTPKRFTLSFIEEMPQTGHDES
jgi:hypothetical protein